MNAASGLPGRTTGRGDAHNRIDLKPAEGLPRRGTNYRLAGTCVKDASGAAARPKAAKLRDLW